MRCVTRQQQANDAAVGEPEHVRLRDTEAAQDLERVRRHELVGERRRPTRGGAMSARVHGNDAPLATQALNEAQHVPVVLAVAVQHEHGRRLACHGKRRPRLVPHALWRVDERNHAGAIRHGHLDATRRFD